MIYDNIAIIIPAYKPLPLLVRFVEELLLVFKSIIVVDDGSGAEYRDYFATVRAKGCTVLTHHVNQGKGRALKTAFNYCIGLNKKPIGGGNNS